jgi:hypothetical protein
VPSTTEAEADSKATLNETNKASRISLSSRMARYQVKEKCVQMLASFDSLNEKTIR